jgi:hypothetical protein
MKSFFRKIRICLFEPRKMGFYIGEKLHRSFLQLLLFSLIVITPLIVVVSIQDSISEKSYDLIADNLMRHDDSTLSLSNGELTGGKSVAFHIEEGLIFINPLDQELKASNNEDYYPILELRSDRVIVSFLNIDLMNLTYSQLEAKDIDFTKIENKDYVELDKFIVLVNDVFNYMRPVWIAGNVLLNLIQVYAMAVASALVLAFFMSFINLNISFKYRLKISLDAQFINLVFMLLALLFNFEYITYLGLIFTAIYITKAFMAIVRIEVRRVPKEEDGKDE